MAKKPKTRSSSRTATQLLEIINASWRSQAVLAAAELGIADLLAHEPKDTATLARASGCNAPSLYRLLRGLATLGICAERKDGRFELTALGSHLRGDAADSLRSWTIWWGRYRWPMWSNLTESVKTGKSGNTLAPGQRLYEQLERDPGIARVFHGAMVELTRLASVEVVRAYDFAGMKRIVDVGGGYGELLATVLEAHPRVRGVLLDLPRVIESVNAKKREDWMKRCEFVAGDFFQAVPEGADGYLLKSVLHNWDDERCAGILRSCLSAMPKKAKLLVVERIMPPRATRSPHHQAAVWGDLNMLVGPGGRERTEAEFRALLDAAGFRVRRIVPTRMVFSVIEADIR
jgi:hypothetical protein